MTTRVHTSLACGLVAWAFVLVQNALFDKPKLRSIPSKDRNCRKKFHKRVGRSLNKDSA